MNIAPFDLQSPISPLTDENAMMRWVRHSPRPRLQTEETLRAANGGIRERDGGAHHIHTMSEENPFLPTDDEIDNDDDGSDVSSVSVDSLKRFQNWVPLSPAQQHEMWTPFVPPREIVITTKSELNTEAVPDWLKLPLRDPSPLGPPASAFAHSSNHLPPPPPLTDTPLTAPHPLLSPCDHLRNMSWATETTTSTSLHRVSSHDSPMVDRPRRTHYRGFSQPISIGSFVGQSSVAGGASLGSTPTSASSSLSISGESFSHTRRANRKLDELVADPIIPANRRINPLKEEVLFMFDKVSGPVKRLVKTHGRCKSYNLHPSNQGCLT